MLLRNIQRQTIRLFSRSSTVTSSYNQVVRKTVSDIHQFHQSQKPISVVTAHDFITAKLVDAGDIDICLVGDSLANTTLGYQDTNELTLEEMLYHVKSVSRGNDKSLIIADLPFGSFEASVEQATKSAIKLVQQGKAQGVKLEGGNKENIPTIEKLISVGIPVMGHVGLTPQKHNALGGFKLQGKDAKGALDIYQECLNLQRAGVFAIVLECIPNKIAQFITEHLNVPTIGIGAGPYTSGQVLVISDMLELKNPEESHIAKFVKPYAHFYQLGVDAMKQYKSDVESKKFPLADEHGYKVKKDVFEQFKNEAQKL
ncbi:ECM31 [Candida theae]|uniref:3-methyl-2-oxobutanoate hydroxymethyltransferase n=1 Tax=Candida theae TaxID=1198502 RepID=A0AAD5BJH1_9ASCO|nr:ECM31 [Candida theae]KAI5967378.1 ECM31 [Candida theae]